LQKGDVVNAIAAYGESVRLQPTWALAHFNLGYALQEMGRWDEAIAQYREAIRLDPGYPEAHCNLGYALKRKGQFVEALASLRRGHELGSKRPNWPYLSKQWVDDCEQLVILEKRFQEVLKGEAKLADADEKIAFAELCANKGLYDGAAQQYA